MALPARIPHDLAIAAAGVAGAPHRQETLLIQDLTPVSYTHLDVYKRQIFEGDGLAKELDRLLAGKK